MEGGARDRKQGWETASSAVGVAGSGGGRREKTGARAASERKCQTAINSIRATMWIPPLCQALSSSPPYRPSIPFSYKHPASNMRLPSERPPRCTRLPPSAPSTSLGSRWFSSSSPRGIRAYTLLSSCARAYTHPRSTLARLWHRSSSSASPGPSRCSFSLVPLFIRALQLCHRRHVQCRLQPWCRRSPGCRPLRYCKRRSLRPLRPYRSH